MFRKLLKIVGFLILMVFIIGTLAFTSHETKNIICRNIVIDFNEEDIIQVNKDEILRLVNLADNQILNENFDQINSDIIEKEVEKHQAILNAEVYELITKDSSSYKGVLVVKVNHREPVVRIMSETGSYYLDKFGDKIPISANYTANVLVSTGYFTEKYASEQLLPFILYVEKDEFWKAQIEQVHIEKDGDIILTPLVGGHFIELGTIDKYQEKLRNMKAFYEQVLAKNNWNKYSTVSLKYNNQVIAKRR